MHVLITGISGYISQYLLKYKPSDISISGTYHSKIFDDKTTDIIQFPLDLNKNVFRQLKNIKPDIVIHTAALSSLAMCEKYPDLAYRINSYATDELAKWCSQINARLIYLSTDIVFDGENAPYAVTDLPEPINIYGKSKYKGELAVNAYKNNTVVRLALVLGQGLTENKNFVDWIIEKINNNQTLSLFFDEIRTPICAIDAAKMLWQIVLENNPGTYHLCSKESIDRFTLGKKISEHYNIDFKRIEKVSISELEVKRPRDASMVNDNVNLKIPSILTEIKQLFL